ncbi:hypothetical protein, partial [Loigolactobacillus coryniformis]
ELSWFYFFDASFLVTLASLGFFATGFPTGFFGSKANLSNNSFSVLSCFMVSPIAIILSLLGTYFSRKVATLLR